MTQDETSFEEQLRNRFQGSAPNAELESRVLKACAAASGAPGGIVEAKQLAKPFEPKVVEAAEPPVARADVRVAASPVRCPYCHAEVGGPADSWVACAGCLARHHDECWSAHGQCATCGDRLSLGGTARLPQVSRVVRFARVAAMIGGALVLGLGGFGLYGGQREVLREMQTLSARQAADDQRRAAEREQSARYLGETATVTALRQKAEGGDGEAMLALGLALKKGDGVSPNVKESGRWLRRGADAGSLAAMRAFVGHLFHEGPTEEFEFWSARVAELGSVEEKLQFAHDQRSRQNYENAVVWYRRAAEGGSVEAMLTLSGILSSAQKLAMPGEARLAEAQALKERGLAPFVQKAEAGGPREKIELANLLLGEKYSLPADVPAAFKWLTRAAESGDVEGMTDLANLFLSVGDDAQARRWFTRAAETGDLRCMASLAARLGGEYNTPLPKDYKEALKWYIRVAEAGDVATMVKLAQWYQRDDAVVTRRDLKEALKWYRRAGEAGDKDSMRQLARFHRTGACAAEKSEAEVLAWCHRLMSADPMYSIDCAVLLAESPDPKLQEEALGIFRQAWQQRRECRSNLEALLKQHPHLRVEDDPAPR